MAVLAGAASAAPEAEPAAEREPYVRTIEWHGVEKLEPAALEAGILTSQASWKPWAERRAFDTGTLEQDLKRLQQLYRRGGYYEATIRSEVVERDARSVVVHFHVEEGEQVPLEEFRFALANAGVPASPLSEEALRQDLPMAVGVGFSPQAYEQAKEVLRQRLARLGYPASTIAGGAQVMLEEWSARVDWTLDPGPYVRLGETTVVGLARVAPALVLGEVRWQPGAPYDPELLRRTQRAIFRLGLFSSVSIRPVPAKPAAGEARPAEQRWPLEIRVQERPPRSLRAGVGFGTEDRVRAKLEWRHRNYLGGLRSLRLGGKYSFLERGAEIVFVQPRFLDRETDLTLDVVLSDESKPAFEARGLSVGWLLERPLIEKWTGRLGQRVEWKRVLDVEANTSIVNLDEDESYRLVFFDLGVRRSSLDSALDPHRGSWLDVSLEPAFEELGSQVSYVKAAAEARVFFPLPKQMVLATRARLAVLEPTGGDSPNDIPVFKRLFSGGSTSVRGFELDHLGPLDAGRDPIGGLSLAEASLELRFPIWRDLGGVAFVDAGQVALDHFELRGKDFFYSAGGGVRYKTPIGPLRLDFAQILNPPSGITGFRVHFSVGHAF